MEETPSQTNSLANVLARLPLISLLIVNAMPLIGVLFFKWDAFLIVLLYWSENVAVGFYNVLKMALVHVKQPADHLGKLSAIPFFIIHYSGFTGLHGMFVLMMFKKDDPDILDILPGADAWPCVLVFVQILFRTIQQAYLAMPTPARWVIATMFVSHGISFGYNYLYKREYATVTPDQLMIQPYGRVVVMHIAVLFGGFLTMVLGSPLGLLVILVILKTAIDVVLHMNQHKGVAGKGGTRFRY